MTFLYHPPSFTWSLSELFSSGVCTGGSLLADWKGESICLYRWKGGQGEPLCKWRVLFAPITSIILHANKGSCLFHHRPYCGYQGKSPSFGQGENSCWTYWARMFNPLQRLDGDQNSYKSSPPQHWKLTQTIIRFVLCWIAWFSSVNIIDI